MSIEVFFSYSHRDEDLRIELETHLSILQRQKVIQGWHDRKISAGTEWAGQIDQHLNTAHVILLLISPAFVASDYCYDIEMQRALERHHAGEAYVIPIMLRPIDIEGTPFCKLQLLPRDACPVTTWSNRDEAFLDVARGIRKVVNDLRAVQVQRKVMVSNRNQQSVAAKRDRLYHSLLKFNHQKQVYVFREFLEKKRIGAFLVHGDPDCSQFWLLKRLLEQTIPEMTGIPYTETPLTERSIYRRGRGIDIATLWRELGGEFGAKQNATVLEIAEQIAHRLKTQNVILVFNEIHLVDGVYLNQLITELWLPIVTQAQRVLATSPDSSLLLFLVDYAGCSSAWNITCTEQLDSSWQPHIPVKLPVVSRFPKEELSAWLRDGVDLLPLDVIRRCDEVIQILLDECDNGLPMPILERIYKLCGHDRVEEERWSRL